jgi:hypothetical protein
MSINEMKAKAFKGKHPVRSQININEEMFEDINHFKYLRYNISNSRMKFKNETEYI